MLKQNKLEHFANKWSTTTYILDTPCACIRSVSRNNDTQLQSDAKDPVLLVNLPTFISCIPWHVIYYWLQRKREILNFLFTPQSRFCRRFVKIDQYGHTLIARSTLFTDSVVISFKIQIVCYFEMRGVL